jgi:chemotaxis signal transduction protein
MTAIENDPSLVNSATQVSPLGRDLTLESRFILTQVDRKILVFPATWVSEILRIDRAQILDLPFYDPLLIGITSYNGSIVPSIAAARLLEVEKNWILPERPIVVRLDRSVDRLENVGIIVDRAIGTSNRHELPPNLFTIGRDGAMVMMQPYLVPTSLWQPQYWSVNN